MDRKQEVRADEEMEDESEEVIPTSRSRARNNKRERPTELAQPPADEDSKNKKMKVDHVEQVT